MISNSPLCPHIQNFTPQIKTWLESLEVKPRAVKVFDSGAAREVKRIDANITTILRRYVQNQDMWLNDPISAYRFVNELGLEGVDILEGMNECAPSGDVAALRRANLWHIGFVEACLKRRVAPCVLNIAVGNPEVVRGNEAWKDEIMLLAGSIAAAAETYGYIGYHGYGPARLLHGEEWYAFRDVLKMGPLLKGEVKGAIQWIHTEAGYDVVSDKTVPSGPIHYLIRHKALTLGDALRGYEDYARRCSELGVKIACLYTFSGEIEWKDYEHFGNQEIMEWYAQHLKGFALPNQPITNDKPIILQVKSDYANLRSEPRIAAETDIGSIIRGSVLTASEYRDGFYRVQGWIGGATVERLNEYPPEPTTQPPMPPKSNIIRAIDISDYSGNVSEEKLRAAKDKYGIGGVIIQLYGGRSNVGAGINRYLDKHRENALRAGLWVAGYIWPPRAATRGDLQEIMRMGWKFVALDVEGNKDCGVTDDFLAAVSNSGAKPVIYTSTSQWRTIMANATRFKEFPLWEARYRPQLAWPLDHEVNIWNTQVGGWTHRVAWQFYGTTSLAGINCDLNIVDRVWLESL